jgi:Macrocin-O-methyltransferase (TylF)
MGLISTPARILIEKALAARGYGIARVEPDSDLYDEDGLVTTHLHSFTRDPRFIRAYARAIDAAGEDYHIRWRAHIALWAGRTAARLDGDFVECGVNRGFLSSGIMRDLDWDSLGKTFFLLDTFRGIDLSLLPSEEIPEATVRNEWGTESGFYVQDVELVRANFAEWRNVRIICGSVPGSLDEVTTDSVAFLHLDMNASRPEVAALELLWPRLVPGAVILLDDYGFSDTQHRAMNEFASAHDVSIANLPTGQGLLLKPQKNDGAARR